MEGSNTQDRIHYIYEILFTVRIVFDSWVVCLFVIVSTLLATLIICPIFYFIIYLFTMKNNLIFDQYLRIQLGLLLSSLTHLGFSIYVAITSYNSYSYNGFDNFLVSIPFIFYFIVFLFLLKNFIGNYQNARKAAISLFSESSSKRLTEVQLERQIE